MALAVCSLCNSLFAQETTDNRVTKDMYLYPIPQSQIEVREGLYTQNPGY